MKKSIPLSTEISNSVRACAALYAAPDIGVSSFPCLAGDKVSSIEVCEVVFSARS